MAKTITAHAVAGRTWTEADAYDSFWPHTPIPAAGPVPEASPFLHDAVLTASLRPYDRYDPMGATAYQRCKAAVVNLLPYGVRDDLPRRKSYYSQALRNLQGNPPSVPIAAAAGLLDPDAIANGYTVPGVTSADT